MHQAVRFCGGTGRSLHEDTGKTFIKGWAAYVQSETSSDLSENKWYGVQSSILLVQQC